MNDEEEDRLKQAEWIERYYQQLITRQIDDYEEQIFRSIRQSEAETEAYIHKHNTYDPPYACFCSGKEYNKNHAYKIYEICLHYVKEERNE